MRANGNPAIRAQCSCRSGCHSPSSPTRSASRPRSDAAVSVDRAGDFRRGRFDGRGVISAREDGLTVSISVVTNAQGRFAFPADRLESGHYTLKARAAGYELDGVKGAAVAAGQETKVEIKLRTVKNLSARLTNAEWLNIYRLDLLTNKMENLGNFKDPRTGRRIGTYGIHSDAQNNAYLLDFSAGNIVKINAKTRNATVYETPTPDSRPRRGRVDHEGRLWFGEYQGNAIGMFDPKTERMTEWQVPTPWSAPYDAVLDRNGEAWTGSMLTDRVARLAIKSGQDTEYMLPRPTNIRRVYVDDSKDTR